ncbi:hypothetical protein [Amphibacillus indicireducens]|uniref:hypothetical protein n=1 Tax=Amphibacillus indicireducens TaxID=1076330 RepID=UPI0031EC6AF3
MIILHDFKIEIEEYNARGKKNCFPIFERCPGCDCISQGNLHRNGFYFRYGLKEDKEFYIPICRLRCLSCKVSISILPSFLIPYFQHTLHTMLDRLDQALKRKKVNGNRQQLAQHIKRLYANIHWVHTFFNELDHQLGFSSDIKKEALKYVKMIRDFGESSFFRKSWSHLSSYFMGKLILPYLLSEKNIIHPT